MRIGFKGSLIAAAAAATLLVAGASLGKPHGERGSHGSRGAHGRGDGPHGKGGAACDPAAVAGIEEAIAATCPCGGVDDGQGGTAPWRNHGQYVRCVAHETRDQLRAAGLKRRCVRGAVPCAARSSCGKDDAVACVVTSTATCGGGTCSNDPEVTCAIDDDCTVRRCAVMGSDRCTALGGSATTGSCCSASPSGAFIDSSAAF